MHETFKKYLQTVQRLGKVERTALRSVLTDPDTHAAFVNLVTSLIENTDASNDAALEDLFVFGAQIADVWPEDEIRFEFSKIDIAVLAFRSGFSGDDFTSVFSQQALADLERQASVVDTSASSSKAHRPKPGTGKKRPRGTRSIELQKHQIAA